MSSAVFPGVPALAVNAYSTATRAVSTFVPGSAGQQMADALAEWGVTVHHDDDAGNSWLLVNLDGDDFPGVGTPHLVAYVYDWEEDALFVDEPLEGRAATWRVNFNNGRAEAPVFTGKRTDPATDTAQCAAFIADYLTAPPAATADGVLLDELETYGITAELDASCYLVPLPAAAADGTEYLTISGSDETTVDHPAAEHRGWTVWRHSANGEPIGDALLEHPGTALVDCAAHSVQVAETVAAYLSALSGSHLS
ncbi:hypothetical protein [Streptomyces griseomycini]|uniref:Uncharacterized protein n=1 Tax=Streptomyces griseomycini TaxID=66895 RepID=A0A7W7PWE9_9ACTN|nr:hypothetical protein [Streptomyces griseomycini]MBB4902597.1 hypothetical protein [Streptomyces griseomycini]GGR54375.1 hypothetical protein GCM10015536_69680 [Streptomyces griseomycini]